jgi:GT2 family glycosyltransferase
MFENVAVIIPVIRPDKAKTAIEAVRLHCPGAEIIAEQDHGQIGCPEMLDRLLAKTDKQLIMFLGDDTIIQPDALQNALRDMDALPDGWGVVGLHTEPGNDHAHWLADRRILEHIPGGQFFSTEYRHCYGDDEIKDIAIELGRWAYASDALVKHDHPITGGKTDEHYQRAYTDEALRHDFNTYCRRKRQRKGFKLAIGFPLVDPNIPVQFFLSFACMDKPTQYTLLVPEMPHGPFSNSLAEARNSLAIQALTEGATHLLMCDTDQVYPPDTLTKLLSHNVDICGVKVHSRWPPFAPIFYRGSIGRYKQIPDDEMESGELVEIDATGTGCLLINMEVFNKVDPPWFKYSVKDGRPVGEDIWFCSQAREKGIGIHVDTSIEVGHLASIEINGSFHKLFRKIGNSQLKNTEV